MPSLVLADRVCMAQERAQAMALPRESGNQEMVGIAGESTVVLSVVVVIIVIDGRALKQGDRKRVRRSLRPVKQARVSKLFCMPVVMESSPGVSLPSAPAYPAQQQADQHKDQELFCEYLHGQEAQRPSDREES